MPAVHTFLHHLQVNLQRLTLALICLAALACVTATVLSALGVWPWITLYADLGGQPLPQAGMYAQIAVTVLSVMLACYLPANTRILALENSHRSFRIQMEDITRAYAAVHAADRQGSFAMASEFDEVKERISFLRSHPDLSSLEPGVLEVAAQMSQVSHELAETYSDANVSRARTFLTQRQQEIEQFTARLDDAKIVLHELQQWARDVDIEESVARSQLQRLREELFSLMPELSAQLQEDGSTGAPPSVVPISKPRPQD